MKLSDLNESLLLQEWWAQDVAKSMVQKGTTGAFTQQCKDMGYQKASYECIKDVEKKFEQAKLDLGSGKISKKEYDDIALMKKRATLAKTFKKWGAKKKRENK